MVRRASLLSLCILLMASCAPAARPALVIDEYLLSEAPNLATDQLVFHFASGNQAQILAKTAPYKDFHQQYKLYDARLLAPFGYLLKDQSLPAGAGYFSIYHGDQLIAKDVMYMRPLSVNASGTEFIGMADRSDGTSLFTRDRFESRHWLVGRDPYVYVGNRLLSVQLTHVSMGVSDLDVYLDDTRVYQTRYNSASTYEYFDGPWAYDGHWALVLLDATGSAEQGWEEQDRLIQDSQDINSVKGYEQSFQFALLDGRPFYFYQKSGKIGISFDGQEIAKGYDEIPHYRCCMEGPLNPGNSMNMVWFFARRASDWYYVEAYIPGQP